MKAEGTIEKFAVAVAIGSLLLLGIFLIVDSQLDGFLGSFEEYSASHSWGVVAAVPAITITYILGAFVMLLSDLVFQRVSPKLYRAEWIVLERLAIRDSELLNHEFDDIKRTKRLLEGSVLPLLVLAFGIYFERSRLPHLSGLLIFSAVTVFVAACSIPFITVRLQAMLVRLGELAVSTHREPQT